MSILIKMDIPAKLARHVRKLIASGTIENPGDLKFAQEALNENDGTLSCITWLTALVNRGGERFNSERHQGQTKPILE